MEKILRTIEKFIPKKIFKMGQPIYHYLLTLIGAIIYRFPARKIFIIGITGTKGKSSVTEITNAILEQAGYKTASCGTIRFKIGDKSTPNKYKMSMPGRFFMQKFLRDAVNAGCTHAVVEITSEGSKQFRHKFIWLDGFIFTNLAPEHIESHGSYDKYREAKLRIADNLEKKNGIMVVNGDDDESEVFLNRVNVSRKVKYLLSDAKPIVYGEKTEFRFGKNTLYSPLPGQFNVYNILAAATMAREIGISDEVIKRAIENLSEIPGRAQKVKVGQDFDVVVDYAHTAESLTELYKAFPNRRKICILGNTGGGRDKWKRPVMAKIAEQYCDEIIFANEDPYDEEPFEIVREMKDAISGSEKLVKIIIDRREAIKEAISRAKPGDVVLISGKGTDPYIMGANGEKQEWSDYNVAKEELEKFLK